MEEVKDLTLNINLEEVRKGDKLKNLDWFICLPNIKEWELEKEENDAIDYHQSILNIGYHWWQAQEGCTYYEMVKAVSLKYGFFFGGLILIGKYNQQVCNGGHNQYYENGYADGSGSCWGTNKNFNHPLHKDLIKWVEIIITEKNGSICKEDLVILNQLLDILKEFMKIDIDTEEEITEDIYNDESGKYEEEIYQNDNFGEMDYTASNNLDKKYYKINIKVMEIIQNSAKKIFIEGN